MIKTKKSKSSRVRTRRLHGRSAAWKWLSTVVVVLISLIVGIIGLITQNPGAVLAAHFAYVRLAGLALLCYENRIAIAEVILELGALIIRIFRH